MQNISAFTGDKQYFPQSPYLAKSEPTFTRRELPTGCSRQTSINY